MTFFPPQKGRLSDYASMLVSRWSQDHEVSVICQSDPHPESTEAEILPVFESKKPVSILKTLKSIHDINPDVVVFNTSIGVWGQNKVSNFVGMSLPLLTKKFLRKPTFTLLHNVYEDMDVKEIDRIEKNYLIDTAVWLSTHILLNGSDQLSVTRKNYIETLKVKYNASNVVHIPHGIPVNDFTYSDPRENFKLFAFGYWSPNKNLPLLLEAYEYMEDQIKLVICGTSHPDYPNYLENIKKKHKTSEIEFRGYIPEEDVSNVFHQSDMIVLPYNVSVGTSGVLNQSMGYGVPVLATDNQYMQDIVKEEEAEVLFCKENPQSLAEKFNNLANNKNNLERIAEDNYQVAENKSMDSTSKLILTKLKDLKRNF